MISTDERDYRLKLTPSLSGISDGSDEARAADRLLDTLAKKMPKGVKKAERKGWLASLPPVLSLTTSSADQGKDALVYSKGVSVNYRKRFVVHGKICQVTFPNGAALRQACSKCGSSADPDHKLCKCDAPGPVIKSPFVMVSSGGGTGGNVGHMD